MYRSSKFIHNCHNCIFFQDSPSVVITFELALSHNVVTNRRETFLKMTNEFLESCVLILPFKTLIILTRVDYHSRNPFETSWSIFFANFSSRNISERRKRIFSPRSTGIGRRIVSASNHRNFEDRRIYDCRLPGGPEEWRLDLTFEGSNRS